MFRRRHEMQHDVETLIETRKVLIVDQDLLDLVRETEPFETVGLEVHKCMSAEAAMRDVERNNFDFAVVDQGSKELEGLRVVRHLIRYSPWTPFVVIARCPNSEAHREALALGALDYLPKPLFAEEAKRIIQSYFEKL